MSKELCDATFGTQLDNATRQHTFYTQFFWKKHEISDRFPALKGLEMKMVDALGKVVVERVALMNGYGSGGLAAEIVESRRHPYGKRTN